MKLATSNSRKNFSSRTRPAISARQAGYNAQGDQMTIGGVMKALRPGPVISIRARTSWRWPAAPSNLDHANGGGDCSLPSWPDNGLLSRNYVTFSIDVAEEIGVAPKEALPPGDIQADHSKSSAQADRLAERREKFAARFVGRGAPALHPPSGRGGVTARPGRR